MLISLRGFSVAMLRGISLRSAAQIHHLLQHPRVGSWIELESIPSALGARCLLCPGQVLSSLQG